MTSGTLTTMDVEDTAQTYYARLQQIEASDSGGGKAWFMPIRKAAMARFSELGFPTTRDEEWRFTNVSVIANGAFVPAARTDAAIDTKRLDPVTVCASGAHRLVFVDGRLCEKLSAIGSLPDGLTIRSLKAALASDDPVLEPHLAHHANYADHAFVALNTALMEDGTVIHVGKGRVVEQPIHLFYVSTAAKPAVATFPRTLIILEPGSQATIVETYVGLGDATYFTNAVTEIIVRENAVLDHYRIGSEGDGGLHIGSLYIHQSRSSNISSNSVTLGGALVRNDVHTVLDGEGCECTLNGFYLADGTRHIDNHLIVDHAKPHGDSREFYKGVLDGKGRGIFSGKIIVRKDAQKTDAKQTNQTLLLSADAQVESKPQLEILADDVKCTHGATIGQINGEALFYLRSRGMSEQSAHSMLVYAFAREIIEKIRVESLRTRLNDTLFDRLPHGDSIRGLV